MRTGVLGTIAGKEFRDHVRSRRFRTLTAILAIIAVTALIDGAFAYQQNLDQYNEAQAVASSEDGGGMGGYSSFKPSVLMAFERMGYLLSTIGAVLGIAMGFDLITAEKESKSLKILLSHPVYRDEVITSKAMGGVAAIALAMGVVFLLSLAVLLISGVVPDVEEMVRIIIFGLISFLFVFSFFAIALFMSTVAKNSGNALIGSLAILIIVGVFFPSFFGNAAMTHAIFGAPPESPQMGGVISFNDAECEQMWNEYREKSVRYQMALHGYYDLTALLSPTKNYMQMAMAVADPRDTAAIVSGAMFQDWDETQEFYADLPDSGLAILAGMLGSLVKNIVALLVFPAAFFGLAWVRFVREDIR
ncbi:ABC transporter permease [uncultured Methanofollis sp.]|mgnify:CR=1 FL=1|uniref:ABC transporter permease n=1 Tax=uncultured Methanofollis sp. TaxID=262500 RepID=UPI00260C5013|nr:ABC transporter permease subunit [uncultured Methanofollis sp.]